MPLHKDLAGTDLHPPGAHASQHESGGADEMDVTGLTGLLATAQTPATHTHPQSDVTNLVADLAAKAPLASPALTGTPTAPTAAPLTSNTQIANTAYVDAAVTAGGGGGGGSGAMTRIAEVVTAASQATVAFSSIPGTYRDLEVRIRGRGTNGSDDVVVRMQFNGDTGANYEWERITRGGNTSTTTANYGEIFALTAANTAANHASMAVVHIANYKGTTFYKTCRATCSVHSGANVFTEDSAQVWRSTSAITDILLSLSAGNFVDGSVVSLYGLS